MHISLERVRSVQRFESVYHLSTLKIVHRLVVKKPTNKSDHVRTGNDSKTSGATPEPNLGLAGIHYAVHGMKRHPLQSQHHIKGGKP